MAYPFQNGYCSDSDVLARIKQGQYNPDAPGGITTAFIEQFILQGATVIDLVLARAGYTVPIVAQPSTTIGAQVWTHLLAINATYAAGQVELWRHSEDATSVDTQAERLLKLADDMLARLETGADNFAIPPFNLAGTFELEADPALAMNTNMDDPDPVTAVVPAPIFSVVPEQAVGYPQIQSPNNPLNVW